MFFKMTTHLLCNIVKTFSRNRRKGQLFVPVIQEFSSDATNNPIKTFDFGAGYTEEEKKKILITVNTCTVDELKRYSITEASLKKITAYRDKNGCFKAVNEVLLMQGIDIGVLNKFCKSIINHEAVPKKRGVNAEAKLLTPGLNDDMSIAIDTCTGIRVCADLISWAQVDRRCNLLQWDCRTLGDVAPKDGLVAIVNSVASIVSKVPPSHAYTMESDPIVPFAKMNNKIYHHHLQRQQIVAAIASILGTREQRSRDHGDSDNLINNIYMMRRHVPARLYNVVMGSEIVSAKNVVEQLITNNQDNKDHPKILHADSRVTEYYKSRNVYEREQMNWSLLLTMAFINLSVMKTISLKKINNRAKRKES